MVLNEKMKNADGKIKINLKDFFVESDFCNVKVNDFKVKGDGSGILITSDAEMIIYPESLGQPEFEIEGVSNMGFTGTKLFAIDETLGAPEIELPMIDYNESINLVCFSSQNGTIFTFDIFFPMVVGMEP